MDTIQVYSIGFCQVLKANKIIDFVGKLDGHNVQLAWRVEDNEQVRFFEVEQSADGIHFVRVDQVNRQHFNSTNSVYEFENFIQGANAPMYYRIKLFNADNSRYYSAVLYLSPGKEKSTELTIYPNPVKDMMYLQFLSSCNTNIQIRIFDAAQKALKGANLVAVRLKNKVKGMCLVQVNVGGKVHSQKFIATD
jgi:hypothetical protein